jgi:hypothetical protein
MNEIDFGLIAKYLKPHSCYKFSDDEWKTAVENASEFGCDWLDHLCDEVGQNVVGHAISDLLERVGRLAPR